MRAKRRYQEDGYVFGLAAGMDTDSETLNVVQVVAEVTPFVFAHPTSICHDLFDPVLVFVDGANEELVLRRGLKILLMLHDTYFLTSLTLYNDRPNRCPFVAKVITNDRHQRRYAFDRIFEVGYCSTKMRSRTPMRGKTQAANRE